MYRKQTAGSRSANFCVHRPMHVEKVHSPLPFFIHIVNALDLHFQGKKNRIEYIRKFHTWLSRKRWQIGQTLLLPTHIKYHLTFWIDIYIWPWPILKVTINAMHIFTNGDRQTLLLPTNRTSHMAFPLAYLYLALAHSKGQGHAHFTENILQIITDRANIAITNKYKVACGLSIGIFTFDLGPL